MMAVMLNEGLMSAQDPTTGIDWRQTIHAEESMIMHRPLGPRASRLRNIVSTKSTTKVLAKAR